jgi:long-chain fatty acid transport protein
MWIGGGISVKPHERLVLAADLQYSRWSETQNVIETDYKDPTWDAQLDRRGLNETELKWKDTYQIRFGALYQLSQVWVLRAGYYFDPSPAPDETANIVLLTNTNDGLTLGTSYTFGRVTLDFAFEYLLGRDREVPFGEGYEMPGIYNGDIVAWGIGFTYAWL